MRALIGVELVRKLPPGPVDIRDTKLIGFVLRVRPSGTHTYFANYARGRWKVLGTTKTLTAPEAREEARKVLGDSMKGADPIEDARQAAAEEAKRITFAVFVTRHYEPWAIAHQVTGAEQVARLKALFGPTLNDLRLDEITGFHVERWRSARLKDGIAASTTNRDLNVLRGALSRAIEWNLLDPPHPLTKVKAARTDRSGVVRYLTEKEEARLMAALKARDDQRRAERDRSNNWRQERGYPRYPAFGVFTDHVTPIVTLALHTGLRRGELFGLEWRDVDLANRRLTVRGEGAKSGQTRHVPLNKTAVATLSSWHASKPETMPDAVVFPGATGEPLDDIKKAWAALVKRAKLDDFRFHDCRHHFASKLVMAGVDLNTVRELLGHRDIKMVLRYAHLAPEHTLAAVERLVSSGT
jgi:integrase